MGRSRTDIETFRRWLEDAITNLPVARATWTHADWKLYNDKIEELLEEVTRRGGNVSRRDEATFLRFGNLSTASLGGIAGVCRNWLILANRALEHV